MKYFLFIILLLVIILIYMRIEASILQKCFINFSSSPRGLKIVHLSDIHINKLYISNMRLINTIIRIHPDIIILSGDYIERLIDIPKFIKLLSEIASNYPVFLSLGNHDHLAFKKNNNLNKEDFIRHIQQTGANVLMNANTNIVKNGLTYNLIGIDDLKYGNPDLELAFKGILPFKNADCLNIAFSHNPDTVLSLPKEKVDYFLCGHFHGGQIWMPFNLEFKILRREKLCKMGYRRGLHKINGINIYINRGIGNVIFPFRFLSTPEIAIIQLP